MSAQFTTQWLNDYEARNAPKRTATESAVECESDLHDAIYDYCTSRGWLPIHGRMDVRSTITKGAPDFIILSEGSIFFVECKTKSGKCSEDQLAFHAHARRLGHTVHIVRSLSEFLEAIKA